MTTSTRRSGWATPAITILSLTTIATLSIATPVMAAGNGGHRDLRMSPRTTFHTHLLTTLGKAGVRSAAVTAAVNTLDGAPPLLDGTGQAVTGAFGAGKEVVYVEPKPGTFPAGLTPDLSGAKFAFAQTLTDGTNTQAFAAPCTTVNFFPNLPCSNNDPLQLDVPFTITFDTVNSTLPTGFFAPGVTTDTISSTMGPFSITDIFNQPKVPAGCESETFQDQAVTKIVDCLQPVTIQIPGAWRPLGLDLTNKVTGAPIAGQRFDLHHGATKLGSAVTSSKGHLKFPGVYLGGAFTLVPESKTPGGFSPLSASQAFAVPAVTSLAQAGKEFDAKVKIAPLAPNAINDAAKTTQNQAKVISVLANDSAVTAPLHVASITHPAHGTAKLNSTGTVTYTPARGFTGTDTFRYVARNAFGGTDVATVTVQVSGPLVLGDRLASTGAASWVETESGLGAVFVGAFLLLTGRRRRTDPHTG